ncbi:hypothetical protein ROJ8625_00308 [Roseivivax jejudonensis]|uniref:Uncharacterized protein n=1 Tax=Roseivivax jejudonensis TaxID=1529041 RepID=A0A1X6Y6N3_9RHOB|nr:hypothetical protein [Roseivivax jejudonensis]SLN12073.1 hypothetical protein ROJ8625_00308 [Roseivivax jejudonensis]
MTDQVRTLDDVLAYYPLLAGEDAEDFETIRQALLFELAPRSGYARIIANNLVELEWERRQYHQMIHDVIKRSAKRAFTRYLADGHAGEISQKVLEDLEAGFDGPVAERRRTELRLSEYGIDVGELVCQAWTSQAKLIGDLKAQLNDTEIRRRKLWKDFDKLQPQRADAIEDAEVL